MENNPTQYDKNKALLVKILLIALILGIAYVVFQYLMPLLMPFLVAFVVSALIRPLVRFFTNKCKIPKMISALIFTVLFYGTIGVLAVLLGIQLVGSIREVFQQIPSWFQTKLVPAFESIISYFDELIASINPELGSVIEINWADISNRLVSLVTDYATKAAERTANIAISLPALLISTIITVIATFFMASDWQLVSMFLDKQFSGKAHTTYKAVIEAGRTVIVDYVKSYAVILIVTFGELLLGLWLVGIKNAVAIAAIIAIFDIMPIVGSGMVMFPWAVISLIQGQIARGLGLLVVWAVIVVFRQYLEPRIIGMSVGIHPIITLVGMVAGASMFGILGMFGFLIIIAMLKRLNEQGVIHLFKGLTPDEKEAAKIIPPKKKRSREERREAFKRFFTKLPAPEQPVDKSETAEETAEDAETEEKK